MIVRSAPDKANFLFRAPAGFEPARPPEEPFLVDLRALAGSETARIRLRITPVAGPETRRPPEALARAREAEYRKGQSGKLRVRAEGARAYATVGSRTVLLVRDGKYLYELFLEGGASYRKPLEGVASGFTILEPKGAPVARKTPEDLKQEKLEHDYYRLKLLKPQGFAREGVDPNVDKGIWLHLRCEDEIRNLCEIRIRVWLARTLKQGVDGRVAAAADRFAKKYANARVPKRPKRLRWTGAKHAFQLKMFGMLPRTGLVIQEEYRFVEHENGRVYEIQVTTYAGAQRAFRKQIATFWRKLKIQPK